MAAVTDDISGYALAAGRGDQAAAAAFVRATQHDVRRFLAHLPGVREVDDLVQETYLRAWRALPSFAGRSTARTWLLAIARRVAVDQVRAATCRPRTANLADWQAAAEATPAGVRAGVDEQVVLHGLLDGLAAERREAFVATQLLGLSYAEAAQVCDVPVGTIRSRVARAREDLIAAMRPSAADRRGDRSGAAG
ncbi:RNA polymerase sigma-70 factor, ECF subfamily [Micromonospora phaseoli]|uniref:RNA polymerase sigma factor n=1 Tax=Micromonospora phaseoli TaxID=1144548 RepID=A0A1H7ADJ9_9ACTN|nr:RNA polymerase sigma-70 factor (ECF subfamily) [Micromonospora phaseoli]SEJ63661.1 RNA polymerase sigma-70 factor, ECF subfamily [Micromonospora phaseoli]